MPTIYEVKQVIDIMYPHLTENQIIVDNSSSDPFVIKELSDKLLRKNVYLFDGPVSGGPTKAKNGTLSCMVGGDEIVYEKIENILKTYSKPQYVGEVGNGCAIKAINNILNVTNLLVLSEGLSALNKYGIDANVALKIINESSGRSLMSIERFPEHIIKGNYNYGFDLKLMKKDVDIAKNILKNPITFEPIINILHKDVDIYGDGSDYTEITKRFFNK